MRMKCTAVHKDSFYFTICGAYHFKTALPSFQVRQANISFFPAISHKVRTFMTEITSKSCVHIFKKYKAKKAESIEHICFNKCGGSICKNFAVLFTFCRFYGIITLGSYLLDKLEFTKQTASLKRLSNHSLFMVKTRK